jgi:hypothetical protein
MEKTTRQEIFTQAARKLRQDFQALTVIPHAGSKGAEGEDIVQKFLEDHLPKRFGVSKGFILDTNDQVSKQTDLITTTL